MTNEQFSSLITNIEFIEDKYPDITSYVTREAKEAAKIVINKLYYCDPPDLVKPSLSNGIFISWYRRHDFNKESYAGIHVEDNGTLHYEYRVQRSGDLKVCGIKAVSGDNHPFKKIIKEEL